MSQQIHLTIMNEKKIKIRKLWEIYNELYFQNKLRLPKFNILQKKRPYGMFVCNGKKKQNTIWISACIKDDYFLRNILLHEMVHQYVYEQWCGTTYTIIKHGPMFHYIRYKLIKKYGLEIRPN